MQQNSNEIKDRMLRSAARMWGGNDVISEPSFDPLVGMLISACAFELENISREIEETRLRVSEKVIDMMVPDVNSGVLAAHALAAAAFSAAVVIGNDVIKIVVGVTAGSQPGHARKLRARRAGRLRTAATGTSEAVNGAVAPVGAALRIEFFAAFTGFIRRRRLGGRGATGDREQRHRGSASGQQRADACQETAPGAGLGHPAG